MITRETITSKQRSKMKAMASTISPIAQIGKGGITDNLLKTLSDAVNLAENVADLLGAIPVAVIGRKAIFYRRSSRDGFVHLEF